MSGSNVRRKASIWKLTGRNLRNRTSSYSYSVIDGQKNAILLSIEHLHDIAASWQTNRPWRATPDTTTRTIWRNMRKPNFAAMTGRQTERTRLIRRKQCAPSPVTTRPISLIGAAPCITRSASLPLTKGTSHMVTTANTKRTGIVRNKAINTESASRRKNGWR